MSPLRALARPLLASVFIVDGVDAIRHADEHAAKAQPLAPTLAKLSEKVPGLPSDPKSFTRFVGAIQVAAGALLAIGKAPRLAAATLAVITVPTTAVKYPVWSTKGEERSHNLSGLLRNAALLGGLIFAAEDRQGRPSLGWRYGNWQERRAELNELRVGYRTEIDEVREDLKAKLKEAKQA